MLDKFDWLYLKGTVSVISSDSPCKYGNAWFTTVQLRALSDQVKTICQCLKSEKPHFYYRNTYSTYLNIIPVNLEKLHYLPHYWTNIGFDQRYSCESTLPSFYEGSLEIKPSRIIKEDIDWFMIVLIWIATNFTFICCA